MSDVRIPVKLFVGKLPPDWAEDDVRSLFSPYGEVDEISLIRPKSNPGKGQKYGCAFVKYGAIQEAAAAIEGLAGKRTVNENAGPLQIQYANGEPERLSLPDDTEGVAQKLFIANVPVALEDDELKRVFSDYGTVTEAYCIQPRRPGATKAAFVRFSKKSDALRAIEKMHDRYTFPNCDRPIAVKCAESKEQRDTHRQDMNNTRSQQSGGYSGGSGGYGSMSAGGRGGGGGGYSQQQQQQPLFQNMGPPPPPPSQPRNDRNYGGGYGSQQTPRSQQQKRDGPLGANVFVYNIPMEWTDADLVREFCTCGSISTTRVIIDSQRNQSKGYGFVSFHDAGSALKACDKMDGFTTTTGKRLKVQIKKGEEEACARALGVPLSKVTAHSDHGGSGKRGAPY
ncbi:hypothetical protein FOL47_006688 [Perkinsus chesapeaki]|uniref:RRM domain-containing protein n=1 Tax=Perkinsus chesapeaki TaxID=330153 RepID=A0A7J6LR93_PERCH|nr:hypothetical protein FOL47_006688 [Perkinsus chesapeaki]